MACGVGFAALAVTHAEHAVRHYRQLAALGGVRFARVSWFRAALFAMCSEVMLGALVVLPCPDHPWYVGSLLVLAVFIWIDFDRVQRSNVAAEVWWQEPEHQRMIEEMGRELREAIRDLRRPDDRR